jgi:hypothetical protein
MKLKYFLLALIVRLIDSGFHSYQCPQNTYAKSTYSPIFHDPNIARLPLNLRPDLTQQKQSNNRLYCDVIPYIRPFTGKSKFFKIGNLHYIFMYGAFSNIYKLCWARREYLAHFGYTLDHDPTNIWVILTHVTIPEKIDASGKTVCHSFNNYCSTSAYYIVEKNMCERGLFFLT